MTNFYFFAASIRVFMLPFSNRLLYLSGLGIMQVWGSFQILHKKAHENLKSSVYFNIFLSQHSYLCARTFYGIKPQISRVSDDDNFEDDL